MQLLAIGVFVFRPQVFAGDSDQPLHIKFIRAHEQMQHLLFFVRFVAHVG